jgi:hypothetical protein
MTRARLFAPLLLLEMSGVACDSQTDSKGVDAGRVSADGAAGKSGRGGAGGDVGPRDAAAEAGGASDGATSTGSYAAGETGPIVGMPLGTFDTTLEGFILSTDMYSEVLVDGNGVQTNLGGYLTGLPRAELSHDATAGSPSPGCLKLSVPFPGSCCAFSEVLGGVAPSQDWSRSILHVRVRVASGTFTGVAQLFATMSSLASTWSTASLPSDGSWQELTLDLSQLTSPVGFDATQIVEFGLQLHVGQNYNQATRGLVVFHIDSFSIEQQLAPSDAGDASSNQL